MGVKKKVSKTKTGTPSTKKRKIKKKSSKKTPKTPSTEPLQDAAPIEEVEPVQVEEEEEEGEEEEESEVEDTKENREEDEEEVEETTPSKDPPQEETPKTEPKSDALATPREETPVKTPRSAALFSKFKQKKKQKKGNNVAVVCRFRPQNKRELKMKSPVVIDVDDTGKTVAVDNSRVGNHRFNFDRIFGMDSHQNDVFEQVGLPTVEDLFHGYNGTVFVYGQTGAGKTFSMMGPNDKGSGYCEDNDLKGLVPRVVEYIFESVAEAPTSIEFTIQVSYIEIYMEKIRDLFQPERDNLSIKEDKDKGVFVDGTTKEYVASVEEVFRLMKQGASNRVVASHLQNAESSRSHSIFIITLNQKDTESLEKKSGTLFLVDLAGSEKVKKTGAAGQMLEEAKQINKSLSALGNVINALTDKKTKFVPYRDSKLTRLLQDSLGGNCRTTLMICCSPSLFNVDESLSTLRFGERAKSIKNKAKVNKQYTAKELMKMLDKAKKELKKQKQYAKGLLAQVNALRSKLGEDVDMDELMSAQEASSGVAQTIQDLHSKIESLEEELAAEQKRAGQLLSERDELEDKLSSLNEKYEQVEHEFKQAQEELDVATELLDENESLSNSLSEKTAELQQASYSLKEKELEISGLKERLADVEKQLEEQLAEEPVRPQISEEMLLAAAEAGIDSDEGPSTPKTHEDNVDENVHKVSPLDPKQIEKMRELSETPEFIKKFKDNETEDIKPSPLVNNSDEPTVNEESPKESPESSGEDQSISSENYNEMVKRVDDLKEQNRVFYQKITQLTDQATEFEKERGQLLKEKDKTDKLKLALIRDLRDRCDKVINLELELDRVRDQKHHIEQICNSKDPQYKILQYEKSVQMLSKKNHQLTNQCSNLSLQLKMSESKHPIAQSRIKDLEHDLEEMIQRNHKQSDNFAKYRSRMAERENSLVREVKELKHRLSAIKKAYASHQGEARVVRALRGGGRKRADSNVERKIIIRGGSHSPNSDKNKPPTLRGGNNNSKMEWGALSPKKGSKQ